MKIKSKEAIEKTVERINGIFRLHDGVVIKCLTTYHDTGIKIHLECTVWESLCPYGSKSKVIEAPVDGINQWELIEAVIEVALRTIRQADFNRSMA